MKISTQEQEAYVGLQSFQEQLHVGRPNIGNQKRFYDRLRDILDRCRLTNNGPYVQEFERRIAEMHRVRHCIAMCNGTISLEIAIRALDLKGEVIVPSFTFIATPNALKWQGIEPVFCDIDPITHCLDSKKIEKLITSRTTGIIGVHTWGHTCDVDGITDIAKRHKLKLLFDAAHAFGCSYKKRMIGSFGNIEIFSFHATKFINAVEGGCVVTNDDELAQKIRLMKNYGFTGYDRTDCIGVNGKMNEISAAMGLTNLESIDEFLSINKRNYDHYRNMLEGIPGIEMVIYDEYERNNFQYIVLEIDKHQAGFSRDELISVLHANNILARKYFYPGCHRMEPYSSYRPNAKLLLPETERLTERVLCLPTGTSIGRLEINHVCEVIRNLID